MSWALSLYIRGVERFLMWLAPEVDFWLDEDDDEAYWP